MIGVATNPTIRFRVSRENGSPKLRQPSRFLLRRSLHCSQTWPM